MEHEPGVAGALADPAIGDDIVILFQPALLGIDLLQLLRRLESCVLIYRRFPRNAICARDMTTTQNTFLRVFGHMGHLALEFTRRTDVDQWFLRFAMRKRVIEESADLLIVPFRWHGIVHPLELRLFLCQSAA